MRPLKAAILLAVATILPLKAQQTPVTDDPYQWLEDVDSPRALDWVRARNKQSLDVLEATPGFAGNQARALAILNDKRRIALPEIMGTNVTNFWQDETNVRGLWRIASVQSYLDGKPLWQPLLDLDALSKAEGRNWVWKGADCLKPDYQRCLLRLSDGGKDAVVVREFDIASRSFVADGFVLPEAKQSVGWWDKDTLVVGTNWGDGSLTESGYPRILKLWRRGTPLGSAEPLAETSVSSVVINPVIAHEAGRTDRAWFEALTFWTGRLMHRRDDGSTLRWPLPDDADFQAIADGRVFALLRSDLDLGERKLRKGSLVSYRIDPLLETGKTGIESVFEPGPQVSINAVQPAKSGIYISLLDTVAGRLVLASPSAKGWRSKSIALPPRGSLALIDGSDDNDLAFVRFSSFTTPDQLYAVGKGRPKVVASLPARFDAARFTILQRFAISKDGTRVPYYLVRPKGARGPLPTWMYGYGGFEIAVMPAYVGPAVQFWLEGGGQYVVANIRGGGEFGPAWHQAALKEHRQRAYDDFHAVAEDLQQARLTTPRQLGIDGRSNGGLLVGVAYTQRPELYHAVLMGVPLADMRRYHKLLAGASWMDEYGDPDVPAEWAYIGRYSPYQNIRKEADYPRVFFYTSTKDDRVHPAHARKMAARMEEEGHPYYYYENIDGGHAGVANLRENAYRSALMLAYMRSELVAPPGKTHATAGR